MCGESIKRLVLPGLVGRIMGVFGNKDCTSFFWRRDE